jgi:hypothetical protein
MTDVGALYYMRKTGISYKKRAEIQRSVCRKKARIFRNNISNQARSYCIY